MARSQNNDPHYNNSGIQHQSWAYSRDPEKQSLNTMTDVNPQMGYPPSNVNANMYANFSACPNEMFPGNSFIAGGVGAPSDGNTLRADASGNNVQGYSNAMLDLGNGQVMRVYFDENNKQITIPMSGQYELFSHRPSLHDVSMQQQQPQPSHMFTINHTASGNNANTQTPSQHPAEPMNNEAANMPSSNFIKEVLGNWEPNSTGTYSPFGQNYPLSHPTVPILLQNKPDYGVQISPKQELPQNRSENIPLVDTNIKKRIVAEVKPMRPTYSDILAKNTKINSLVENSQKAKILNVESKSTQKPVSAKAEKVTQKHTEENKHKNTNKKPIIQSSGSDSGETVYEETEKRNKTNKKAKNKNKYNQWDNSFDESNEEVFKEKQSQFVFIEDQKTTKSKKKVIHDDDDATAEKDFETEYSFNESSGVTSSTRKKREKSIFKISKQAADKKKTLNKWRRNKPGYLGLAQNYLEHWWAAISKAMVWFWYLLLDVCHMSMHLSFDLCTSVFTQSYISCQAVLRNSNKWTHIILDNRCLRYIDDKFGNTMFGFWRKFKWFRKEVKQEENNGSNTTKLDANISLPATGDEAMKRLLACKGKNPYSILGVSESCTDEEIKRYYRRQAFLVHPDKNQQPGAEEAFKILQHAFDIIGEPERRECFDRQAMETKHAEAAWTELSDLLAQLQNKMEFAANTIRCTNCGQRHKRVLTDRPCYAARYCAQCKIRHSAKEGDIWAESGMMGLIVMYYACMDGAVYQITNWATCQKRNLNQLRPDCHMVQYRIVLGSKAAPDLSQKPPNNHDPNLEDFLNNLYGKAGQGNPNNRTSDMADKKKRHKKAK